jgi:hypothetical protein
MNPYEIKLDVERPYALLDGSSIALQPQGELPLITAEFLERRYQRAPKKAPWVLRLTTEQSAGDEAGKLQAAIATYYKHQATSSQAELKLYWHSTLQIFLYGGIFLGVCLGLHQVLEHLLAEEFPHILDEGLIIIAWVALWKPAEMLTYNWVPLVQRLSLQRRLAKLSVQVSKR